jgi:nucleoside-diphosphate-sugar epimerase
LSAERRVLVTGAGGLIGSGALQPLIDLGYEVHAAGRREGSHVDVRWHRLDLLDEAAPGALVRELSPSHLLHLAWYTEHGRFWEAPENLAWVGATLRLLRSFADASGRRAVIAGTCAEYDWSEPAKRLRERAGEGLPASPECPGTLYGMAKRATRQLAEAYAERAGVSIAWGRVFLLYGPGEDQRRLLPSVARALLSGREAATTDGSQVRDLLHAADVAGGFVALLDSPVEGPVNVASGEGVPLARVIELIAEAAGRPELLRLGALPPREGDPPRLVADVRRLREEVGFTPRIPLAQGIADTVEQLRREGVS